MLDHGTVKTACRQIATGKLKGGATCPTDLAECAKLLPQLQASRFEADYDPTARFDRSEVTLLLAQADQVIRSLRAARRDCRPELHLFLLQCAGAKR